MLQSEGEGYLDVAVGVSCYSCQLGLLQLLELSELGPAAAAGQHLAIASVLCHKNVYLGIS